MSYIVKLSDLPEKLDSVDPILNKIVEGDCLELMKRMPRYGVGVVLTDPPYGRSVELSRRKKGGTVIGDESTSVRDRLMEMVGSIPQVVFGSPMCAKPLSTRAVLIWDKSELAGMGDLKFPWKITHEEVYIIGNGYSANRRDGSVMWFPLRPSWSNHKSAVGGIHPTEKPVDLITYLLRRCPSGVVFDPFLGSGTTAVAAKKLGRNFIGCEISPEYCRIAEKRLMEIDAQPQLEFHPNQSEQLSL